MVRKGHWKKSSEKSGSGARDVKQAEEIRNVYEPLTWLDQFMALRTTKSNLDNEEFAKLTCLRAFARSCLHALRDLTTRLTCLICLRAL